MVLNPLRVAVLAAAVILMAGCRNGNPNPTPAMDRELPEAAEALALEIRELAERGDIDGLARIALEGDGLFTASFGGGLGDPEALAEYWRAIEERGEPLTDVIVTLIDLPEWFSTASRDKAGDHTTIFVTPRFMHEPTQENRRRLEAALGPQAVAEGMADGQWLGWRIGIRHDGHWQFFVRGD